MNHLPVAPQAGHQGSRQAIRSPASRSSRRVYYFGHRANGCKVIRGRSCRTARSERWLTGVAVSRSISPRRFCSFGKNKMVTASGSCRVQMPPDRTRDRTMGTGPSSHVRWRFKNSGTSLVSTMRCLRPPFAPAGDVSSPTMSSVSRETRSMLTGPRRTGAARRCASPCGRFPPQPQLVA